MATNGNGTTNGNGNGNGNGKAITIFERIFNISRKEWSRVLFCFSLSLLPRIGFVIGWTALTAMFVATYGISFLPTFFIGNAILIIIGSSLFTRLIGRASKESLMMGIAITASLSLFTATFFTEKNIWFFLVAIASQAFFLSQLTILTSLFMEDQFSPLESERAFPLIESAETIGSIIGGLIIVFTLSMFPLHQIFYLWIFFTLLVAPLLFCYRFFTVKLPRLPRELHEVCTPSTVTGTFSEIQKRPFLRSLLIIVIAQWVVFNMLEFQYIKAVEQRVTHRQEQTLAKKPQSSIFHVSLLTDPTGLTTPSDFFHSLPRETLAYNEERNLASILGQLHMLFGILALLTHLFFASRFLQSIGIANSMLIHPFLVLGSFAAFFLKYGFLTAVITKANFEIGHALSRNAYHASFYAIPHRLRELAKEFLEGIGRPFGVILGMGTLLLFHFFWTGRDLTLVINFTMIIAIFLMLVSIFSLKKNYTRLAEQNLFHGGSDAERFTATEILAQKGHDKPEEILIRAVGSFHDQTRTLTNILIAMGKLESPQVVPILLTCLEDSREEVRMMALQTLERMSFDSKDQFRNAFSRYRMISSLKSLFEREHCSIVRSRILRLLSKLREGDAVEFILQNLSHENQEIRAHCILACGKFRDPGVIHYIEPALESDRPQIRASAAVALWQFPWLQEKLKPIMDSLFTMESVIPILGEMHDEKYSRVLRKWLHSENPTTRFETALALARLDDRYGMEVLVEELIVYSEEKWAQFLRAFHGFPHSVQRTLQKILSRRFSEKIARLLETVPHREWHELPLSVLAQIQAVYELLGRPDESYRIEKLLQAV